MRNKYNPILAAILIWLSSVSIFKSGVLWELTDGGAENKVVVGVALGIGTMVLACIICASYGFRLALEICEDFEEPEEGES